MDRALIEAIFKREPMWNSAHRLHKNAVVLRRLWEEVAVELQRDVKTIRGRWKNLRAYFFKEHQKMEKSGGGGDEICTSSWQYFNQLLFLKSYPVKIEIESNLGDDVENDMTEDPLLAEQQYSVQSDSSHETISNNCHAQQNYSHVTESCSHVTESCSHASQRKNNSMTTNQSENNDQLLLIEKKKLEILERETTKEKSDDLLFFESLLPYMSNIPLVRKLRLRSKIQDLILAEIETAEDRI